MPTSFVFFNMLLFLLGYSCNLTIAYPQQYIVLLRICKHNRDVINLLHT
jgi:hypothetical protein